MNQLNERLGQFIAAREIDRLNDPDARVARSLAALFHPVLYPGVGDVLRITQQELGYLVGLSRQRVNEALSALQERRDPHRVRRRARARPRRPAPLPVLMPAFELQSFETPAATWPDGTCSAAL